MRQPPYSRPRQVRRVADVVPATAGSYSRGTLAETESSAGATRAAVLEERARIARELHDSVSQTLYAITLGAARARRLLEQDTGRRDVQQIMDDVLQLANVGQAELRALLTDMRSDRPMSGGLAAALADLAEDVRRRNGVTGPDIRVSVANALNVPAPVNEALLMIVREALHNVARHSAAGHVRVVLQRDVGQLVLLITDDGRGFDPATPRTGHFGLQSMRERAGAVGGTLAVTSAVGAGTQVRVSVPVPGDTDG